MRILQVTNIVSHHQLPLARCLAASVGDGNFRFAVTEQADPKRQQLGWNNDEKDHWILRTGDVAADCAEFERWWHEADVVFCGERLFDRIKQRLDCGRLTFYMSERWFKPPIGRARLLQPGYALMANRFRRLASSPNFHYLPIGDFAARDMQRIAGFQGRMWRWGYFTSLPEPLPSCERSGAPFRVLWAGRMLGWKRVDTLIRAFATLLIGQPDAHLTLVGDGPERNKLERLSRQLLPPDSFQLIPPRPVAEIMAMMRQHHVYVLSSNAYEGWGAVVNEAMAEGCVVVASEAAGSARSIIRHEENGLLFTPGDWQRLGELLCRLAKNLNERDRLARSGQKTMAECWSPQVAAERFLAVSHALLAKKATPLFNEGPMAAI